MTWEAIGAIGETVGAIGVILTMAYLAIQIRENSRQMRANSVVSINHLVNEGFDPIYNSERDQRIYLTGCSEPDSLNEEEFQIYMLFVSRLINSFITVITQHSNNVVDDHDYERYMGALKSNMQMPGYRRWYELYGKVLLDRRVREIFEKEILVEQ